MKKNDTLFEVTANDGNVYGLVDTRAQAEAVVELRKLGRDGKKVNTTNVTRAHSLTYTITEVPASKHPSFSAR